MKLMFVIEYINNIMPCNFVILKGNFCDLQMRNLFHVIYCSDFSHAIVLFIIFFII